MTAKMEASTGAETDERTKNDAPRWMKAPKKTSTSGPAPEVDAQRIPLTYSGGDSP